MRVRLSETLTTQQFEKFFGVPPTHGGIGLAYIRAVAKIAPSINHLLGRTAADSQLQSTDSDEICSPGILRHGVRVFISHVDHCGADLNPSGLCTDRGEQWERRCELPRKVMDAEVGSVHSQALGLHGKDDGLQERIRCRLSL